MLFSNSYCSCSCFLVLDRFAFVVLIVLVLGVFVLAVRKKANGKQYKIENAVNEKICTIINLTAKKRNKGQNSRAKEQNKKHQANVQNTKQQRHILINLAV